MRFIFRLYLIHRTSDLKKIILRGDEVCTPPVRAARLSRTRSDSTRTRIDPDVAMRLSCLNQQLVVAERSRSVAVVCHALQMDRRRRLAARFLPLASSWASRAWWSEHASSLLHLPGPAASLVPTELTCRRQCPAGANVAVGTPRPATT